MKLIAPINRLLLFSFLIVSIFFLFHEVIWQNVYIISNSDLLYVPSFTRDFSEGIYNWKLWVLPPAPSFFPDLFFSFIVSFISSNLVVSNTIYGTLFAIVLIFSTTSIFRLTDEFFSFEQIVRVVTLGYALFFFILSFYPKDIGLFLVPSYHGSSFLFSIILYSLIFKTNKKNKKYLFFLISVLAIMSDKQIFYTFYFPFIVTSVIMRNDSTEKYYLKTSVYLIISFLIAALVLKILSLLGIFQIPTIPIWTEFKKNVFQLKVIQNIQLSLPEMRNYFIDFYGDKFLLFCLFFFSIGFNLYYSLPISKAQYGIRFLSQIILWIYFFSIFSQMFFGIWGGFRYMWAIYLLPYLSIFYYTGNAISKSLSNLELRNAGSIKRFSFYRNKTWSQNFLLGFNILFIFIFGYFFISNKNLKISLDTPYPPFVSCLDRIKERSNLFYGLSDYWNAKHIRYLSRKNLIVNQVFANLERYDWVHNREWYEKDRYGNPIQYNFIIPERLDRMKIETRFGKPNLIEECEGKEIFIYERGFHY